MMSKKLNCFNCQASYYSKNQESCGICNTNACPNCLNCDCTKSSVYKKQTAKVHTSKVINVCDFKDHDLLELNGTLSPLISQEPIKTNNGKLLKTEFEFNDETGKIEITCWGPVPLKLFPYRYEYCDIILHGVKKKLHKGKPVVTILKSTKIFVNNFKSKNLSYYLSEAV